MFIMYLEAQIGKNSLIEHGDHVQYKIMKIVIFVIL